ncbi:MAG: FAD-dependent oxidoreductase [Pseudanabaenaceae cyanobacterium bins.68]|nr:FAD-dependent oxidoreductase [Pseudanabaenaceae cyanobacterium bins.68]
MGLHFRGSICSWYLTIWYKTRSKLRLNVKVGEVSSTSVCLTNGEEIMTETAIWTTGLEPDLPDISPPLDLGYRQRVEVLPTLQLTNNPQVYALGDLAAVNDQGKYLTGVAPEALQQGVAVARNISRQLQGRLPKPFRYFNKGRLAIIGGYGGVRRIGFVNLTGFVPWLLWLAVHVVYLPGYYNRWRVMLKLLRVYLLGHRSS